MSARPAVNQAEVVAFRDAAEFKAWLDAHVDLRIGVASWPNDQGRAGTMRIGLTSIYVDDQDQAEQFYTQVLGLQVKTNAAYGPGERWLTVVSPEEPDGVELVLHLTDEPARAFQAASRELGRPVISLRTDDCVAEAERLTARGGCSSGNPRGWPTAASTRSLPTPAATCSTSTRTDQASPACSQSQASVLSDLGGCRPITELASVQAGAPGCSCLAGRRVG